MAAIQLRSRRGLLIGLSGALVLAGCGFQLRKAPEFQFQSIAVPATSSFANQVKRNLRATGTVEVVPTERVADAQAVLEILAENREAVVISTNAAGQVRELQLRLTVRFRVRSKDGRELLAPTEISQSRDITYNETAALAKEGETALLYRDMESDIAQQILRRLAAARPA
ncbi:LPS assembly lipoprotein LptE [Variovorax sp. YR216]|uniref:LPS-assembly lipoprotein LptE n=1 Tax=Variovorax sp. YR216 TaxID=1882828 RepID=UPI00089BCBC0|nr:LPS assembly lipoprotein LptE [Variovorax sp. YR216]SEB21028.1 LPS-assembly lipoprotein [Variovorax sp. YR216]